MVIASTALLAIYPVSYPTGTRGIIVKYCQPYLDQAYLSSWAAGQRIRNFTSINAMTMRHGGEIAKVFPFRSAMRSDDFIARCNDIMIFSWRAYWIRHVGFLDFSKTLSKRRNGSKSN